MEEEKSGESTRKGRAAATQTGRTTSSCHQRARNAERSIGRLGAKGWRELERARARIWAKESELETKNQGGEGLLCRYFRRRLRRYRRRRSSFGCFPVPGLWQCCCCSCTSCTSNERADPPSPLTTGGDHLPRKRKRARCGAASRQPRIHSEETTGTACGDSTMATSKTEKRIHTQREKGSHG